MSTKNKQRYTITDGPTVDRIWDAAKYSADKMNATVPVRFTTDIRFTNATGPWLVLTPHITGVEHEDGSGDSLIISGYLNASRFTGYYKGRNRSGFIEISA